MLKTAVLLGHQKESLHLSLDDQVKQRRNGELIVTFEHADLIGFLPSSAERSQDFVVVVVLTNAGLFRSSKPGSRVSLSREGNKSWFVCLFW